MTTLNSKNISIISSLIFLTFFSLFFVANAHDDTEEHNATHLLENTKVNNSTTTVSNASATTPTDGRGEMQRIIEERQTYVEERKALREERQVALTEVRQQRILNLAANISNRMEAAIARIFNIIDRLEIRIEKMKELGTNTEPAEAKLREAAQLISEARAKLNNIDSLVQNATTASEPKTAWQTVRQTYSETGELIRKSHQALRETIALLKSAGTGADIVAEDSQVQATSTTTE